MSPISIETYTLGLFQVHSYLVWNHENRHAVLIDSGAQPNEILNFIATQALILEAILYTHTHLDHVEGYGLIKQQHPEIAAYYHSEDDFWLEALPEQAEMFRQPIPEKPVMTDTVSHGEWIKLKTGDFEVRHCPGHTPGGVSYVIEPHVFTGDSLFKNTIGRTDFPRGDHKTLVEAISRQLLSLPDHFMVYSGHGGLTTIGEERLQNPYLR
jgi:hydroxyacylglutathione hydrolase